jgi:multisubunit Na+/H+ antiporter MnhE subunit
MRFAAWWLVLFWTWLLYNGQWTHTELVAAACAGAIGATAAEVAWRHAHRRLRFRPQHLRRIWLPLWRVVPEFLEVAAAALAAPFRPLRGAFVSEPVGGRMVRDDPAGRAERVFVTYAATLSANDYVVDADRDRKLALRHVLLRRRLAPLP